MIKCKNGTRVYFAGEWDKSSRVVHMVDEWRRSGYGSGTRKDYADGTLYVWPSYVKGADRRATMAEGARICASFKAAKLDHLPA